MDYRNRLHNPETWRRLIIVSVILIIFVLGMISIFELIITHRSANIDFENSKSERLPLPDIHWPLRNGIPDIARPKRFDSCPFYQINYNILRREENLLVSDCHFINSDERTFAFQNVSYNGKRITVYAPGHFPETYFGDYCNVEVKTDASFATKADIVLIKTQVDYEPFYNFIRPEKQIWIMNFMESPENTKNVSSFNAKVKKKQQ
uniref:Uncharacterized protein n=1 Tax=Panagrolaimus sp. PS1159 TaxID=55785 RepID=A0AC35ER61_9BILA